MRNDVVARGAAGAEHPVPLVIDEAVLAKLVEESGLPERVVRKLLQLQAANIVRAFFFGPTDA